MTDNGKLSSAEVQSRLLNIIPTLSESKSRRLLNDLEKWQQTNIRC